jgi:hypothetical protein
MFAEGEFHGLAYRRIDVGQCPAPRNPVKLDHSR